jgi:transposase InsO family protein
MKEWLTARELANEALPDLPTTESAMIRYAARNRWADSMAYARSRSGRGGGIEFHVALLPTLARLEYERRHRQIEIITPPSPPPPALVLGADLTDRAARERDARLAIVTAFDAFAAAFRMSDASKVQIFVDRYNLGSHHVPEWVRQTIPTLSKRSLARWRAVKGSGRVDRLAIDRSAARKGKGIIETANGGRVRTFVLALIAHQPLLTAAQVLTQVRAEFGDELVNHDGVLVEVPPVRTFQHALKALKTAEKVLLTKLSDPDRYRSTMAPSGVGTYAWVSTPNALWMIDASPVDALCVDGRWSIYACIDIATRRTIWYVSRTPRAEAVAMLIRKALLAWGVPDKIKTDNGSDFKAQTTQRLLSALGIEVEYSDPYSPQQKGHVERAIETFQHDCAALLPGFIGHNVSDRKRIEDRKGFAARLGQDTAETFGVTLTGPQLQDYVDRWAGEIYLHRDHGGLDGLTPHEAAARSPAPIRTVEERALDVLLMPAAGKGGLRTVTKFGIRIDGNHYVIHEALPGTTVLVRMDPMDAGRVLAFDAETGRYVGDGICPSLRGISAATLLAAKREITTERLAKASREVRADIRRLIKGPNLLERALQVAVRDAETRGENVVALPTTKRTEEHTTPAIAAALDVGRPAPRRTLSAEETAELERMRAEFEAGSPTPQRGATAEIHALPESPKARFRRAVDLEARRAAGLGLAEADARWLGLYQTSAEYLNHQDLYRDFGGDWLTA